MSPPGTLRDKLRARLVSAASRIGLFRLFAFLNRQEVRARLAGAASRIGLFRLFAFFNRRKVAILFYHGVSAREVFPGIENYQGKHVRDSRFRDQLRWLAGRYRVLPLSEVVRALRSQTPLPPYTVAITFDDGYQNNVTAALPRLQEAGLPATFFLSSAFIGTDASLWVDQIEQVLNSHPGPSILLRLGPGRTELPLVTDQDRREADRIIRRHCKQLPDPEKAAWLASFFAENGTEPPRAAGDYRFMSWSQARELREAGMAIGSHTMTHAIITRLPEEERRREIEGARAACEKAVGAPCDAFAYPNGRAGDFSAETGDLLRRLGFSCGLTTVHGLNPPEADPFTLRRIGVGDRTPLPELEAHLSGFTDGLLALRRRLPL
jgi:peptidoglycan/xylan/chitin deacetylase (PgdA/CDA1 family)